jgi:hypothetical protein
MTRSTTLAASRLRRLRSTTTTFSVASAGRCTSTKNRAVVTWRRASATGVKPLLGREPLEDIQRPLVDREDEGLAVVTARDPLLQDLSVGAGVGIGDNSRAERFQLRPQPFNEMGLAVAGVPGHDDLATGLGLLNEVVVGAEVDVDRLKFVDS